MNKKQLLTAIESMPEEELEKLFEDAQKQSMEIVLAKVLVRALELPEDEKE